MKKLLILALAVAFCASAYAQSQSPTGNLSGFTPQPGTPLRNALMDTIRAHDFYPTRELAQSNPKKILFKVLFLKVSGDWALANVLPLQNGKDYADPRWNLIHQSGGEWRVVDYLEKIQKYYKDDAEFWSAIDMDANAASLLQKEMPQIPKGIFPKQ